MGGWCSSFAKKNDPDNYIYCRITVLFTAGNPDNANCYWATGGSAVFNAEEGNWQFASAGIVAPNNCTYIRVVLQMNRQMNLRISPASTCIRKRLARSIFMTKRQPQDAEDALRRSGEV